MEWSTLGCPIRNNPTHHHNPRGGQADNVLPTNLHIPLPILPQDSTRQPPATFEDEVQSHQQKQLTMLEVKH